MTDKIDFHAMNDHDLLVMSVMQGNETVKQLEKVNSTIKNHEKRLIIVETLGGINKGINLSKKQAVGLGSVVFILGSFVAGIIEGLLPRIG